MLKYTSEERDAIVKQIPKQLLALKKKYNEDALFNSLSVTTNEAGLSVSLNAKGMEQYEKDAIWLRWEQLLNGTEAEQKFAKDLIKYSYITTGFNPSLGSFYDMIPTSYMNNGDIKFDVMIKEYIKSFNNGHSVDGFVSSFMQHHWSDSKVVPQINNNSHKITSLVNDKGHNLSYDHGFKLNEDQVNGKITYTVDGVTYPKPYILIKGDTNDFFNVFSHKEGDYYVYKPAVKLGSYDRGNRVVDYGLKGVKLEPINTEVRNKELGKLQKSGDNFYFDNINATFTLLEDNKNGVIVNTLYMLKTDINGNTKRMRIEEFESNSIDAMKESEHFLREVMGHDKLLVTLNSPC